MLQSGRWLVRHPGALLGMARGATLRDLILREDLRRLGYPLTAEAARGLGETRLCVALVTRLLDAFADGPPRTLLDVGAARGSFSTAAAIAFPGLQRFAFEPLPEEFAVLARQVEHAFPCALGDANERATIHVSANPGSSSLVNMLDAHVSAFPGTATVRDTDIDVRRLDDVVAAGEIQLAAPVLMKIDVQGAEDRVLRGAEKTLHDVDTLIVEMSHTPLYDGQLLAGDMRALIESHGFRFTATFDELRSRSGDVVQTDGLFRRK